MKNVKFLLSAASCAFRSRSDGTAQDFSDPKYAVWGDTPQGNAKRTF